MADAKISALPAVVTPAAADEFACNQSGITKKQTRAQIHLLVSGETLDATKGTFKGTLATAAQPNVTSLGTLDSLIITGDLTVDTDTLFVDSANNRVGIGTLTPSDSELEVVGDIGLLTIEDALYIDNHLGGRAIIAQVKTSAVQPNDVGVNSTATYAPNNQVLAWEIGMAGRAAIHGSQTSSLKEMSFHTTVEAMRIIASGQIGIGTRTPDQLFELEQVETITGAVTDGFAAGLRLDPGYTAASALTVTRHNYIDVQDVSLAGAGPAALTDAAVLRFDAALGTHKATTNLDKTANAKDGTIKVNIDGTIYHIQLYAA